MLHPHHNSPTSPPTTRFICSMDTDAVIPAAPRLRGALLACGIAAVFVAAALLAVTLTVFHVCEPVMTMNAIALKDFDLALAGVDSPMPPYPASPRLTVVADVSVTNPNAASLCYRRSETSVYYRARRVGEATGGPGMARARGTVRLNVTVDVAVGALLGQPGFLGDVAAGAVAVTTATRVRGRVAVLGGLVHRHVVLEMNCTATIAVADMSIRDQSCLQRVCYRAC